MRGKTILMGALVGAVAALFILLQSPAQEFSVNLHRFDPYQQYKFRVKWDGRYIPGISKVSGLKRKTQVVTARSGNSPGVSQRLPGQITYEPIRLERGRTHDPSFEQWAGQVQPLGPGPGMKGAFQEFRKDITIELYNEAGQLVMAYRVYRCWPSEYTALGKLDANNPHTTLESIKLEHDGWARDLAVVEPAEPSFSEPN